PQPGSLPDAVRRGVRASGSACAPPRFSSKVRGQDDAHGCIGGEPMRGTVKWFNDSKGYGFIRQNQGDDVFVHHSAIVGDGFRTLAEGEEVEFEVQQSEKGVQATNVIRA